MRCTSGSPRPSSATCASAAARQSMRRSPSRLALAVLGGCGAAPASATVPSCPTDRPVVLASRADLARIASCTTLAGVVIRTGAALDTSGLGVVTITGDLSIGPTVGIQEVTLGKLRAVDGAIRVSGNGLLQGLFFRQLQRAGAIDI